MGYIRAYYEQILPLQESEWAFIAGHFEKKLFAKHEVITRFGKIENFLSFIESGLGRSYLNKGFRLYYKHQK